MYAGLGKKQTAAPIRYRNFLIAIFFVAYFLFFNWESIGVHFAIDGFGNIGHYYNIPPWQLVVSQFVPWRGDVRPLGALFYLPIYHFAGLNPAPYQAVLMALMLVNVFLVYRFALLLGSGVTAAFVAALLISYHSGMSNLYYNGAFVFDVLCLLFYLAAFNYYATIRNRGRLLRTREKVLALTLFLCALSSKEMAVTLPITILVYEWLYHRPKLHDARSLAKWIWGPGQMVLLTGILTALATYGKISGPEAMITSDAYRPVLTAERLKAFQQIFLQDVFLSWAWFPTWKELLLIWGGLALFALWRAKRTPIPFLVAWLVVTPIPIEFLMGKRAACLALPMVAWAILAGVLLADIAGAIVLLGQKVGRMPGLVARALAVGIVAVPLFLWAREQRSLQRRIIWSAMATTGVENWDLIQQLEQTPRPLPGQRALFLGSPVGKVDLFFLAQLWVHDRSIDVLVDPPQPGENARIDRIYEFRDRKLAIVR